MTVYVIALFLHSYVRWGILLLALLVIVRASLALRHGAAWSASHERTFTALIGLVDLQFTIGVCLFLFLSPFADAFIGNPAMAIKERVLRFFGLEHPLMMTLAVALFHVGRVRAKKATLARDKHRHALWWTLVALLIVLSSIPWPGLRHGRPLLRAAHDDGVVESCKWRA